MTIENITDPFFEQFRKMENKSNLIRLGIITTLGTGACIMIENAQTPAHIDPTPTSTNTAEHNPASAESIKIGPYQIAESGVGYVNELKLETGNSEFEDIIKEKALEAFPEIDNSRVKVYDYVMQGQEGEAPFPLIVVTKSGDPNTIESAFAGFAIDQNGILVPPYEPETLGILIRLTYKDGSNNTIEVGAQSIEDPSTIYEPAFFRINKLGNPFFVNPYTDGISVIDEVQVNGGFKFAAMIPQEKPTPIPGSSTVTPEATASVETFAIVNNPESPKISTITLEDLSSLAKFEHSIVDKKGPISNYGVDYSASTIPSVGITQLGTHRQNEAKPHSQLVKAAEFVSIYEMPLDNWGFEGITGNVATYAYEDVNKNTAMFRFLLTHDQAIELADEGVFTTDYAKLVPFDKLDAARLDDYFIVGKPNGDKDLREIGKNIYTVQGYRPSDIKALFERIAATDTFTPEDVKMIESLLFIGYESPANHD